MGEGRAGALARCSAPIWNNGDALKLFLRNSSAGMCSPACMSMWAGAQLRNYTLYTAYLSRHAKRAWAHTRIAWACPPKCVARHVNTDSLGTKCALALAEMRVGEMSRSPASPLPHLLSHTLPTTPPCLFKSSSSSLTPLQMKCYPLLFPSLLLVAAHAALYYIMQECARHLSAGRLGAAHSHAARANKGLSHTQLEAAHRRPVWYDGDRSVGQSSWQNALQHDLDTALWSCLGLGKGGLSDWHRGSVEAQIGPN